MKIRSFFGAAALCVVATMAHAQQTRSALSAQNNSEIKANGVGAITGTILNGLLGNIINSMGALTDTNSWTGANTFSNSSSVWNGAPIGTTYGGMYGAASGSIAVGNGSSGLPLFVMLGSGVQSAIQNAANASGGLVTAPVNITAGGLYGAPLNAIPYGGGAGALPGFLSPVTGNGPLWTASGVEAAPLAPHVASNASLASSSTAQYPLGVWRDNYASGFHAAPLFFQPETGNCAANSLVNDGGSCVNDSSGNSYRSFPPSNGLDVAQWGADPSASASANATAINAAETYCSSVGGRLYFGYGTYVTNFVTLLSNCYWKGQGRGNTIIQLASGQNTDLLVGSNAYSLFGTNSQSGISDWGIEGLTLDGNYANETTGSCLAVYGFRYTLKHVGMQNCNQYGWRTGYGPFTPSGSNPHMEGDFDDIQITKTGQHGIWFAGPHDSTFKDVIVTDASCSTSAGYYGFLNDTNGGARLVSVHVWNDQSLCLNRPAYALYDTVGGLNIMNGQFEGAVTGAAYFAGSGSSTDQTTQYFAVSATNARIVTIAGNNNVVEGVITDTGSVSGQVGLLVASAGNRIDIIGNSAGGLLDFTGDTGLNTIIANGVASTAVNVGSPSSSDMVLETVFEASTNHFIYQIPGGASKTCTVLPTVVGGVVTAC